MSKFKLRAIKNKTKNAAKKKIKKKFRIGFGALSKHPSVPDDEAIDHPISNDFDKLGEEFVMLGDDEYFSDDREIEPSMSSIPENNDFVESEIYKMAAESGGSSTSARENICNTNAVGVSAHLLPPQWTGTRHVYHMKSESGFADDDDNTESDEYNSVTPPISDQGTPFYEDTTPEGFDEMYGVPEVAGNLKKLARLSFNFSSNLSNPLPFVDGQNNGLHQAQWSQNSYIGINMSPLLSNVLLTGNPFDILTPDSPALPNSVNFQQMIQNCSGSSDLPEHMDGCNGKKVSKMATLAPIIAESAMVESDSSIVIVYASDGKTPNPSSDCISAINTDSIYITTPTNANTISGSASAPAGVSIGNKTPSSPTDMGCPRFDRAPSNTSSYGYRPLQSILEDDDTTDNVTSSANDTDQQTFHQHVFNLSMHMIDHEQQLVDANEVFDHFAIGLKDVNASGIKVDTENNNSIRLIISKSDTIAHTQGLTPPPSISRSPRFIKMHKGHRRKVSDKLDRFLHERPNPEKMLLKGVLLSHPQQDYITNRQASDAAQMKKIEDRKAIKKTLRRKLSGDFRPTVVDIIDRGIALVASTTTRSGTSDSEDEYRTCDIEQAVKDEEEMFYDREHTAILLYEERKRHSLCVESLLLDRMTPSDIIEKGIISAEHINRAIPVSPSTGDELNRVRAEYAFELHRKYQCIKAYENLQQRSIRRLNILSFYDNYLFNTIIDDDDDDIYKIIDNRNVINSQQNNNFLNILAIKSLLSKVDKNIEISSSMIMKCVDIGIDYDVVLQTIMPSLSGAAAAAAVIVMAQKSRDIGACISFGTPTTIVTPNKRISLSSSSSLVLNDTQSQHSLVLIANEDSSLEKEWMRNLRNRKFRLYVEQQKKQRITQLREMLESNVNEIEQQLRLQKKVLFVDSLEEEVLHLRGKHILFVNKTCEEINGLRCIIKQLAVKLCIVQRKYQKSVTCK